jgi:hypothetical protein
MWTKISVTPKLSKLVRGELFTISTLSGCRIQDAGYLKLMQVAGSWYSASSGIWYLESGIQGTVSFNFALYA